MRTRNASLALLLLAVAVFLPACDKIYNPNPGCDPELEPCPFTGNHPTGLDPKP